MQPLFALFNYAKDIIFTHDEVILTIKLHFGAAVFGEEDPVALFDLQGHTLPLVIELARPYRNNLALCRFLFALSGMMMPPAVFASSSRRFTRRRSFNGRIFITTSHMTYIDFRTGPSCRNVWFPNSIFARFSGSYLKLGKLYGQNRKNQGKGGKKFSNTKNHEIDKLSIMITIFPIVSRPGRPT